MSRPTWSPTSPWTQSIDPLGAPSAETWPETPWSFNSSAPENRPGRKPSFFIERTVKLRGSQVFFGSQWEVWMYMCIVFWNSEPFKSPKRFRYWNTPPIYTIYITYINCWFLRDRLLEVKDLLQLSLRSLGHKKNHHCIRIGGMQFNSFQPLLQANLSIADCCSIPCSCPVDYPFNAEGFLHHL